jgi:hypothetical protein
MRARQARPDPRAPETWRAVRRSGRGFAIRVFNRGRPTPRAGATTRTPTTRERVRRMAEWCASATTAEERLRYMANWCAIETMRRARYWGIRS